MDDSGSIVWSGQPCQLGAGEESKEDYIREEEQWEKLEDQEDTENHIFSENYLSHWDRAPLMVIGVGE